MIGFEQYGNLSTALRETMGLGQMDSELYRQRSRVQVWGEGGGRGAPFSVHARTSQENLCCRAQLSPCFLYPPLDPAVPPFRSGGPTATHVPPAPKLAFSP